MLAEATGWDGVFLEDYICFQGDTNAPTCDPWIALAGIAIDIAGIRHEHGAECDARGVGVGDEASHVVLQEAPTVAVSSTKERHDTTSDGVDFSS